MRPEHAALLQTYERLRAVEEAVFAELAEKMPDTGLNFAARQLGLPERGDHIYEHADFGVVLDFALHHHRLRGATAVDRRLLKATSRPETDAHAVLLSAQRSRVTLLRLGEQVRGLGVQVEDLLFGGAFLLVDPVLSRRRSKDEKVIMTRVLEFEAFSMTPCTSWLDFDPVSARMLAEGLRHESPVPLAERLASADARLEFDTDLVEMAICSVQSVREGLENRYGRPTPPACGEPK